jgi:hypothetical protein
LILDFPAFKMWENNFQLFKPPGLGILLWPPEMSHIGPSSEVFPTVTQYVAKTQELDISLMCSMATWTQQSECLLLAPYRLLGGMKCRDRDRNIHVKASVGQVQWLTPVILATCEAEIRRRPPSQPITNWTW